MQILVASLSLLLILLDPSSYPHVHDFGDFNATHTYVNISLTYNKHPSYRHTEISSINWSERYQFTIFFVTHSDQRRDHNEPLEAQSPSRLLTSDCALSLCQVIQLNIDKYLSDLWKIFACFDRHRQTLLLSFRKSLGAWGFCGLRGQGRMENDYCTLFFRNPVSALFPGNPILWQIFFT